jgi:hypothetical protein
VDRTTRSGRSLRSQTAELHSWTSAAHARDVERVTADAQGAFDPGYQDAATSLLLARHEGAEASQRHHLADPAMQRNADGIVLELEWGRTKTPPGSGAQAAGTAGAG